MSKLLIYLGKGKAALIILVIISLSTSYCQTYYDTVSRFPIGFLPSSAHSIEGLAIGPIGSESICNLDYTRRTMGLNIQIIGYGIFQPFYAGNGNEMIQAYSISADSLNGTLPFFSRTSHSGLLISGFGTWTGEIHGVSVSPWMSYGREVKGLSVNLLWNLYNKVDGVCIGLVNQVDTLNGIQIGLFNTAQQMRGLQIGLWNSSNGREFPIIHWGNN